MSAKASSLAPLDMQEEGVLRDVLDELDKERSKRAELEAKIRSLEAQQDDAASQSKLLTLQYEVEGYKQVVETLTASKPAIVMAPRHCTIPIHVLRLLEIIPWDARAHDYIFQHDRLYEWQIHVDDQWQSQLKHFSAAIRNLPIIKSAVPASNGNSSSINIGLSSALIPTQPNPVTPTRNSSSKRDSSQRHERQSSLDDDSTYNNNLLAVLAGGGNKARRYAPLSLVLTDSSVGKIYQSPDHDYPLPSLLAGGTWEWVGVWQPMMQRQDSNGNNNKNDDANYGWAYGSTIQQVATELKENARLGTFSKPPPPPPSPSNALPKRLLRCRTWSRRRVLVAYPNMCEATKAYLRQLADAAKLTATCRQLTEQLESNQTALSKTRDNLKITKAQLVEARRLLQNVVMNRNESPSESRQEQAAHDTELIIEYLAQSKLATGPIAIEQNCGANGASTQEVASTAPADTFNVSKTLVPPPSLLSTSRNSSSHSATDTGASDKVAKSSSSISSTGSGDMFDWKRLGRGALLDRIKSGQQQQHQGV